VFFGQFSYSSGHYRSKAERTIKKKKNGNFRLRTRWLAYGLKIIVIVAAAAIEQQRQRQRVVVMWCNGERIHHQDRQAASCGPSARGRVYGLIRARIRVLAALL